MSCRGGNCGCGCGMYPDLVYTEKTATETLVMDGREKNHFEGPEMGEAAENGSNRQSNCTCNPCKCNPCKC